MQPQSQTQPTYQHQQQAPINLVQPQCQLGNETYQLGERWNPNLPPFGVQVCVLCECIIRQKKSCFEPKVTCRRIINECPIIDSCPDGREPMTFPGQCCKTCPTTVSVSLVDSSTRSSGASSSNIATETPEQPDLLQSSTQRPNSSRYEPPPAVDANLTNKAKPNNTSSPQSSFSTRAPVSQIVTLNNYRNERVKEYQSIVKTLRICSDSDSESGGGGGILATPSRHRVPTNPTSGKRLDKGANSKHDFNSIDTRSAFRLIKENDSPSKSRPVELSKSSLATNSEDNLKPLGEHQQHPNDFQSTSSSSRLPPLVTRRKPTLQSNSCALGDEAYQVNEIWHPILPPLGIQYCVVCSCNVILDPQQACYEAKVACRRINKECPPSAPCQDGKEPISVEGQCCKSCPNPEYPEQSFATSPNLLTLERAKKESDGSFRESQSIMRAFPTCLSHQRKDSSADQIMSQRATKPQKFNHSNSTTVKRSYPMNRSHNYRSRLHLQAISSKIMQIR